MGQFARQPGSGKVPGAADSAGRNFEDLPRGVALYFPYINRSQMQQLIAEVEGYRLQEREKVVTYQPSSYGTGKDW